MKQICGIAKQLCHWQQTFAGVWRQTELLQPSNATTLIGCSNLSTQGPWIASKGGIVYQYSCWNLLYWSVLAAITSVSLVVICYGAMNARLLSLASHVKTRIVLPLYSSLY